MIKSIRFYTGKADEDLNRIDDEDNQIDLNLYNKAYIIVENDFNDDPKEPFAIKESDAGIGPKQSAAVESYGLPNKVQFDQKQFPVIAASNKTK